MNQQKDDKFAIWFLKSFDKFTQGLTIVTIGGTVLGLAYGLLELLRIN